MAETVTVNDVLGVHVGLDMECMDRIYLNGYVPNLQVSGQVASFMTAHLGYPIPSPAIMDKIGTAFRGAVDRFADDNKIPVVRFGKDDRKIDVIRPYLARQAATGRAGVAPSGVAQECTRVFLATKHTGENHGGVVRVHQGRPARHFAIGALSAPDERLGPPAGGHGRKFGGGHAACAGVCGVSWRSRRWRKALRSSRV